MVILISKDKEARDQAALSSPQQEVAVEKWDDSDKEGSVDGIITFEHTETLPPDIDEQTVSSIMNDASDTTETTVTSESEPSEETSENEDEDVDNENGSDETSLIEEDEPISYILEHNGRRLSTSVKWANLNATKKDDNSISYSVNGTNVTLSFVDGSRDAYRNLILSKAESLNADIKDEVISYSPSRMYDMYEYDKYTLTYFKNESDSAPSIVYYLVSEVDEGLIYLVTISSDDYINNDSEIFGILEYSVD